MSVKAAADKAYESLKAALTDGKFPPNVADTAVKLCERLHEPVRVSVMGLPGSGKSAIVNLLLNKRVVPEGVRLPTTQYLHSDVPFADCTLPDGTKQTVDSDDAHAIAGLDPMFVQFHLSLPALGRISVLEVVAPEAPQDQQRAMKWAAKRTDIALYCSREFSSIEQSLWGAMPDHVKDHALMLITHADVLQQEGRAELVLDQARYSSEHEFNKILGIATTDALAARRKDGTTDKALMKQSGGLALISSILRQVDRGLQATVDQADLLLHKFKDAEANDKFARTVEKPKAPRAISQAFVVDQTTSEKAPAPKKVISEDYASRPVVEVVSSQPIVVETAGIEAASEDAPDAFILREKPDVYQPRSPETKPNPAPADETLEDTKAQESAPAEKLEVKTVKPLRKLSEPLDIERPLSQPISINRKKSEPRIAGRPVEAVAPVNPDAPKRQRTGFMPKTKQSNVMPHATPETCTAYSVAIAHLAAQGQALAERLKAGGEIDSDDLVAASTDDIIWLSEHLDNLPVDNDPVLEKNRAQALDASELVQLMQFEKNKDAGIEALTLVIQLKRDLEAEIARSHHIASVQAA